MSKMSIAFPLGGLRTQMERASSRALASGALQPIATEQWVIEDAGVRFLVRKVSSLTRKDPERREREPSPQPFNPFLPYEPDLFVADISDTHLALLNKFNVIDNHLLIVTRSFMHQETLLDEADFFALIACMREFESLGFYNGGRDAGASQIHKHLQIVPLPMVAGGPPVPIETLLELPSRRSQIHSLPELPFQHAFRQLDFAAEQDLDVSARELASLYREMLAFAGLSAIISNGELRQSGSYNLLLTRRWILLVPRLREQYNGVSVNALGFAGSLFVRDDGEMETFRRAGPMAVLRAVSSPSTLAHI